MITKEQLQAVILKRVDFGSIDHNLFQVHEGGDMEQALGLASDLNLALTSLCDRLDFSTNNSGDLRRAACAGAYFQHCYCADSVGSLRPARCDCTGGTGMKTDLMTLEHPYCVRGNLEILSASGEVPIHDSLDAATDYLEAVVHGLRDLMQYPEVSNLATLAFYAAETALALVYSASASVDPSVGGAA